MRNRQAHWPVGNNTDAIPLARHTALTDDDNAVAAPAVLGSRAEGRAVWGVLRGDVDDFGMRLRRLQTIEEHVQLSVLYKQFFAGELEVLASLPEFWRKVNLLYTGGDDFAVYGAWDALIAFARELQRLFQRFTEEQLKDFPGPEGKTITMALALAPELGRAHRLDVRARRRKAGDRQVHRQGLLLSAGPHARMEAALRRRRVEGRIDARWCTEFGASPEYIRELCGIYRETKKTGGGPRTAPRGAALAISSPVESHFGQFAVARFSKSARQPGGGPGGKESRESEVAARRAAWR